MSKKDPNLTDRDEQALLVRCSFCGAGIGMECWTTWSRNGGLAANPARYPHKQRIKALWRKISGATKN